MRNEWVKSKYGVGPYKAIRYKYPNCIDDRVPNLAGARGEIWVSGENKFKAVLKPGPFQKKALKRLNSTKKYGVDSELILEFDLTHLDYMIVLLHIPLSQKRQIWYANNF